MIKRSVLALCCVPWAVTCFAQTALRPDQIIPGSPNITTQMVGNNLQIATVIPWRTDNTASPTFTTADLAKVVELTFNGPITATMPSPTGGFADGASFTIQVGLGVLTLNSSPATISGLPTIIVGPYQSVNLVSKAANWYANVSQKLTSVWNPLDKAGPITLTQTVLANDTGTGPGAAGWAAVRSTQSYAVPTSNKKVFTLKVTAVDSGSNGWIGGVGASTVALTAPGGYPGSQSPSYGVQALTGSDYLNGTSTNVAPSCFAYHTWAVGDVLWLAIDFSNGKVYCSTNCTTWANGANPDASNTTDTGKPTATLSAGTYLPMWGGNFATTAAKTVINTKPNLTGCTNLTTFLQWG